jgi:hypothetical protein
MSFIVVSVLVVWTIVFSAEGLMFKGMGMCRDSLLYKGSEDNKRLELEVTS